MLRWRQWLRDDSATAAVEAAFLFPVLVTILCGTIDVGIGLVVNQKVINASQMVADLLAREEDISDGEMDDAVVAGRMAIQPYSTASYGVDVAGIRFLTVNKTPTVQWRDTVNMEPNTDVTDGSAGLGLENEGVIAVTVRYFYEPYFGSFIIGNIQMEEVAYVRGRNGLFVTRS